MQSKRCGTELNAVTSNEDHRQRLSENSAIIMKKQGD